MTASNNKLLPLAFATLLLGTRPTTAHMEMIYPPPLKSKANPYSGTNNIDYSMTSPLKADGSDFPCKGYLSLLGAPEGKAVASWTAGGEYNFTISGGASHGGGSCQVSLSVDGGKTFRVVHSYEGGCPGQETSSFKFGVPGDTPAAEGAVFAWSWFNNLGNREMYMNCAVVDIVSGGQGKGGGGKVPFDSRPGLFTANIGNGCRTVDSADVKFPDPGPDVDSNGKAVPPVGSCGAAGSGSSSSSGFGGGSATGGGGHGSDPGTGSGAGTSSTGGGYSGKHPSSTQAPFSTTAALSPSQNNCEPAPSLTPQPTPMPVTDESGTGWTPGNDWPYWFQSGASRACHQVYLAVILSAMLFAYYIF
jgi:hypothetical protein